MSELVGRFLSFEERLGRGLVRLSYYVLLFLLVMTSLWDITTSVGQFGDEFWHNLWRVLVTIPFTFFVKLLLLRLGAEVIMAVLSISESLQTAGPEGDVMSSGLNVADEPAPSTMRAPPHGAAGVDDAADQPAKGHSEDETTAQS